MEAQKKGSKMGFKRNITITASCVVNECLISLIPTIFMIYIFFMIDRIGEIFSTLLIVPYFILIFNVVLIIISLIAKIFLKTKYYVEEDCLVVKIKNHQVNKINYDEIIGITYDFGMLKRRKVESSQLVLFGKEYKQLLSINNPSIIMVHMIKKKCKNLKVSYYNNKRFLYLLILINATALLMLTLIKLFH